MPTNCFRDQNPADAMTLLIPEVGRGFRLSEHFVLSEVASKDGAPLVKVHPALILLLENVRRHFGQPVIVSSGYRTPDHNRAIGGAKDSVHMKGMAADIVVRGVMPLDVQNYLERLDIGGLGRYTAFTHVDVFGHNRRF